jgi:NADPH-dependent ferric siderophore reductase
VIWVLRGEQDLLEATRQLTLPEGDLYAWVATESALSRKVRRILLDEFKLDEAAVKAAGYWRLDDSDED